MTTPCYGNGPRFFGARSRISRKEKDAPTDLLPTDPPLYRPRISDHGLNQSRTRKKTNLLTKRNCEEVAAVECEYPQPECLPTLNLLPSVDLFQVFRYCCSATWWTFATGEIALNTEAKCRDPRHDTLHDFV